MEEKILLFYQFHPLPDPEAVRLWQWNLCQRLGLHGRIIVSPQGINGTVGGELQAIKQYAKATKEYAPFHNMVFKRSPGRKADFPRLSVKVRPELVAFDAVDRIVVTEEGVQGTGQHISPQQLHELHEQYGDDLVLLDGRNAYEAAIGKFRGAVVPDTRTTRDFLQEIQQPQFQALKDKPIVTYCTGGVRCEILSTLMQQEGFQQVYQLDGGIVQYGKKYHDKGLWEGALYVFDERMVTHFSDEAKTIGVCSCCGQPAEQYTNCAWQPCHQLMVACDGCADDPQYCCDEHQHLGNS